MLIDVNLNMQSMKEQLKTAMKEKDDLTKGVIRLLQSRMNEIKKMNGDVLSETNYLEAIKSELNQTWDAYDAAIKANRHDIAEKELQKIELIQKFTLPQLSKDDIKKILLDLAFTKDTNKGKVMGFIMKNYKYQARGKWVDEVFDSLKNGE